MEHMTLKLAYQQFNLHNNFAKRRFWQFGICLTRVSVLVMCRSQRRQSILMVHRNTFIAVALFFRFPKVAISHPHGVGEGDMTAGVGMNVVKTTGFKMEIVSLILELMYNV